MAIKFSQFTVRTSSSDLSHIVGYNGVDNIQITPTNFLNSALTGTAGQVLFYDTTGVAGDNDLYWNNTNKRLGVGTTSPAFKTTIYSSSTTDSFPLVIGQGNAANNFVGIGLSGFIASNGAVKAAMVLNRDSTYGVGDIHFLNNTTQDNTNATLSDSRLVIKKSGNVGIGTTSPSEKLQVEGNIKVGDSQQFVAGASNDLQIYHDGSNSFIRNINTNLIIKNEYNDGDIIFESDDGSGNIAEYFRVDGSDENVLFSKMLKLSDNVELRIGGGNDIKIYHDTSNSYIKTGTEAGNLIIEQNTDDADIIFKSDDGSGGVATYFKLDGSTVTTVVSKEFKFEDNVKANFGTGIDLQLYHTGTKSLIVNVNGDLDIQNQANDGDILFKSDDGSGGVTTYMTIDGGEEQVRFFKPTEHGDGVLARFGNSGDLRIYHDGSNSHIQANGTGDLFIQQFRDDGDIVFQSDDGSGGVETYFYLDGGASKNVSNKNFRIIDSKIFSLGSSDDFQLYHNTADSWIENYTGNINIRNRQDDGDIIFYSDDGSGGHAQYFRVDGGAVETQFVKSTLHYDNVKAQFGDSRDLQIYHDGTDSFIQNFVGNLEIQQGTNDGDIIFKCDNGSGGTDTYFKLWGAISSLAVYKDMLFVNDGNGGKLKFGASQDLQIYHDGSNSFIADTGTGKLKVLASQFDVINAANTEFMAEFIENAEVRLYHNNSKKFETTSTGIKISGVSEYADNAAAIAGGLTTGDVYRTGDLLKIVH